MSIFRIAERYRVKHAILKYMHGKMKYNENHVWNTEDSISSLQEIATGTGIPLKKVVLYHHLIDDKEAKCLPQKKGVEHSMIIDRAGIDAVIEERWIREGRKELNERIYDTTKWTLPLLAILVTIASLWYSVYTIQSTNKRIGAVREEIVLLQERVTVMSEEIKTKKDIDLNRATILIKNGRKQVR